MFPISFSILLVFWVIHTFFWFSFYSFIADLGCHGSCSSTTSAHSSLCILQFRIFTSAENLFPIPVVIEILSTCVSLCQSRVLSTVIRPFILWFSIHFRESLSLLWHSYARFFEWEVIPWWMIRPESNHILDTFSTWCTEKTLSSEHRIIFSTITL